MEGGLPRKGKSSVSLMEQLFCPCVIVFSNESAFLGGGILGRALMGSITLTPKGGDTIICKDLIFKADHTSWFHPEEELSFHSLDRRK